MKKILIIICIIMISSLQAQETKPLYEKEGDLVKMTKFYDDGEIKEVGYYKNKIITGTWSTYDKKGKKTAIAKYENGKKVGKWFMWSNNELKEIDFKNNKIADVQIWKEGMQVATN